MLKVHSRSSPAPTILKWIRNQLKLFAIHSYALGHCVTEVLVRVEFSESVSTAQGPKNY